jgi:phage terminase large subunit-like protein
MLSPIPGMPRKPIERMTPEEKQKALAAIDEQEAHIRGLMEMARKADPFQFFEPSGNTPTQAGWDLLRKYIRPEDLPQRLDGQVDCFKSKAPIVFITGSNQSAKTTTTVIRRLIRATGEVPPSMQSWFPMDTILKKTPRYYRVVAEDYTNGLLKNVIPAYQQWVPRKCLIGGSWEKSFSEKKNTLTLVNNGKICAEIEFMSNKQEVGSFQGPPRDGIDYDEEPQRDIYNENLMRMITAQKMDQAFGMTPTKGITWVKELYDQGQDESGNQVDCFRLCAVTNPAANLKVLDELMSQVPEYDVLKMRLLGEFVSLSGLVYGRLFDDRIHCIRPFDITRDYVVYRGLDVHLVTNQACVWVAVDRENNYYIINSYFRNVDTEQLKDELAGMSAMYRLGWSRIDKSADSDIQVFKTDRDPAGMNVYKLLSRGKNAIQALQKSDKYTGSIIAGVDEIKRLLKVDPATGKPKLFVFNTPENKPLIHAFKTMERDTFVDEDDKGPKDKIKEGKHHLHAALRYIFQGRPRWFPEVTYSQEAEVVNERLGY